MEEEEKKPLASLGHWNEANQLRAKREKICASQTLATSVDTYDPDKLEYS